MDEETHLRLIEKLTTISAIEADSTLTSWNGVRIWVGSVDDNNDYHLIIDTPEGNHHQILLHENGTIECLTPSKM